MASDPKRTRKRDKLRNFLGFSPSPTPQLADSSTNLTSTRSLTPSPIPPPQQPSDVTLNLAAMDAHVVPIPPPSLLVKTQKAFTKGQSFEKDIALLSASFILQETSDLKELVLLITIIHDDDEEDKLSNVLEICAQFTVQLSSVANADRTEATRAITAFRKTVERVRASQLGSNAPSLDSDGLKTMVNFEISNIKPSFLHNGKDETSERLSTVLDVTIGTAISVLNVVHAASSLIPVPWVQPVVGQVVRMLQAVSQTRSNYNDMKEITAMAGEFVISCAVIFSENPAGPSSELKRALNKFRKKLEGIAEECDRLSRLGLFSRYFQQDAHSGDLQALRTRLNNAIDLFQNDTLINIKLDTEVLKRNFDFASLNNLPDHPQYERNEYLENSRDDVMSYVSGWITNGPEPVLWIYGAAGLGKSTVAQQLIYLLQSDDRLAGGVLLTHIVKDHPVEVIRMVAKQLGEKHPQTIANIAEAARKLNSAHDRLSDYFATYLINPVRALKYPYQLVIVIDGLDEWANRGSFLEELTHIPLSSPVKFILTSRFNYSIERVLDKVPTQKYALPSVSQTVIEGYFDHHFELNDINWRGRKPDQHKIRRLAARADGSLIWAATVRSLVLNKFDKRYPHAILDQILSSEEVVTQHNGQLERLYRSAILNLFPPDIWEMLRDFLRAVMVLQEGLSIPDFAHLLGIPEPTIEEIHWRLEALQTRGNMKSKIIYPATQSFHGSFLEFIQSVTIKFEEYLFPAVSPIDAHFMLANKCLALVFGEFLPSLRGQRSTFSELRGTELYAVKFWPLHLSNGTERTRISAELALADVSSTALCHWSTLFLPHVSPRFQNEHYKPDSVSKSRLPYKLAKIIGDKDATTLMYHIHCLEIGVRLQLDDTRTWVALGKAYDKMYEYGRNVRNLEEEIDAFRRALELTAEQQAVERSSNSLAIAEVDMATDDKAATDTSMTYGAMLGWLANALQTRFDQQGALNDLDEVVSLNREALDLPPAPHPDRSMLLNNLANALCNRFEQQGAQDDLNKGISLHREALDLRQAPHPDRSRSLLNLANALHNRFGQQSIQEDLDEAIYLYREALDLRKAPHPNRSMPLNNLAAVLRTRFNRRGAPNDLDEAISFGREALDLRPAPHPDRHMSLNNLSNALWTRYNQQSAPADLDEAISLNQEAIHLSPAPHPFRSMLLNNLAAALLTRFELQEAPDDLDKIISLHQEALDLRPSPHPDRYMSLNNLANALWTRFNQQGAQDDLNEAILMNREALDLHPASHPNRSTSLNNLAAVLHTRFEQQGASNDLDEAISLHREALNLCPEPHPDRWMSLSNLGAVLRSRFIQKHVPIDLADAISLHYQAIALCSPSQSRYSSVVEELLLSLDLQFKENPDPKVLDELIRLYRQLLDLPLVPIKLHSWALEQLPIALRARYKLNGDFQDLKEASDIEAKNLKKA